MNTPYILFVESDGDVLQHAMPLLNSVLDDCEIILTASAQTALEVMSQRECCVVVASFGANLVEYERFLDKVQQLDPAVVRYAFVPESADQEESLSIYHASQCFSTQIPPEEIAAAIKRGKNVWRRCREIPGLPQLLAQLNTLPTPPTLYFDIREEMNSSDCDIKHISRLLSQDPALCARLLKLANSGFYALPRTVSDVNEAVMYLGTNALASLVLATHVFSYMPVPGINLEALWRHSLATSVLARQICQQLGADRCDIKAAEVAGLLHDMGQLILLSNMPERYFPLLRQSGGDEFALLTLEQEAFGVGHPELCGHILALWNLPENIVEAVASHHDSRDFSTATSSVVSKAVWIAEWLAQEGSAQDHVTTQERKMPCIAQCTQAQIDEWRASCSHLLAHDI